jgi:hypothetical protein
LYHQQKSWCLTGVWTMKMDLTGDTGDLTCFSWSFWNDVLRWQSFYWEKFTWKPPQKIDKNHPKS